MNELCIYAGVLGPTTNGPVTVAQLMVALDRAEDVLGSDFGPLVELKSDLCEDTGLFRDENAYLSVVLELAGEGYYQSSPIETVTIEDMMIDPDRYLLIKDSKERSNLFEIDAEMGIKDFFYGRFVMSFGPLDYVPGVWDESFATSLRFSHSENFPYDAGISAGSSNLTLVAAKGRRSMGQGYTGNLALGDVYNYQEYLRAGFFSNIVSVYAGMTNFDSSHYESYKNNPFNVYGGCLGGFKNIRYDMSLEVNLTRFMGFTFSLINMCDSESSFDLRALNPFYIMHNIPNFTDGKYTMEANNFMTFDVTLVPLRRWQVYFQFAMDQYQSEGEVDDYLDRYGYVDPNAIGVLANLTYANRLESGNMLFYGEFVYNSPGMYLNQTYYDGEHNVTKKTEYGTNYCWSQDYLVGYHRTSQYGNDVTFAGYGLGPDVIVGALGARYAGDCGLDIEGKLLYIAHGEKGRGTSIDNYIFTGINGRTTYTIGAPTGIVEYTAACTVEAEKNMFNVLSMYVGCAYAHIWNFGNIEGKSEDMVQFAIGLTLHVDPVDIFGLVKKGR